MPAPPPGSEPAPLEPPILHAIALGWQKYTTIHVPILAIIAVPHDFSSAFKSDSSARAAAIAADRGRMSTLANAFEAGIPSARVVRLPNANHYIFNSNRADVLREMNAFLATLP